MKELVKKVKLCEPVDIETLKISRDHYFLNAFVIELPLDSTPDHVWQDMFEQEWRSSRHLWDRKLFIVGDKLRLVTSQADMEDKLDWVRQIVAQTNNRVDEYHKEMETNTAQLDEQAKRQIEWTERANVDTIRDMVRKHLGA
jgi:hypothetical protein